MLKLLDPDKDYIVCTDASLEGFRGFLMHDGHIIFYESWKLKENEKNYVAHNLELAEIIHADQSGDTTSWGTSFS